MATSRHPAPQGPQPPAWRRWRAWAILGLGFVLGAFFSLGLNPCRPPKQQARSSRSQAASPSQRTVPLLAPPAGRRPPPKTAPAKRKAQVYVGTLPPEPTSQQGTSSPGCGLPHEDPPPKKRRTKPLERRKRLDLLAVLDEDDKNFLPPTRLRKGQKLTPLQQAQRKTEEGLVLSGVDEGEAIKLFRQAIRLAPRYPTPYRYLAQLLEDGARCNTPGSLKYKEKLCLEALKAYQEYLRLVPRSGLAKEIRKRIESLEEIVP